MLDAAAAREVRDAGAVPERVAVGLDRLEQAKAKLDAAAAPEGVTWAVDIPTNSLVLGIPVGARDAATRRFIVTARALDVPVRVEKIAGEALPGKLDAAVLCGRVLRYNATVRYAEETVRQMIETNVCTQPGDSGGALFAGSQAQGVVSGGSIAGCGASGFRSYFQPINEALNTYGLTLR